MRDWLDALLPEGTPAGQARAVTCEEELVTVGAGAGTGKTWVLSARFAYLLLAGKDCLPQNLLTLTFTEAASREMQERIRKRTLDLLGRDRTEDKEDTEDKKDKEDKEDKEDYRQAVRDGFDEMWISTIHSFASRMIRESGLSLDIDPQSKIIEPPQEDAFWSSLVRALETLELASFALAQGKRDLREAALALERDEVLAAALEKWGASALCDLARAVIELHSSLGHDGGTLSGWADEADPRSGRPGGDSRARAAAEAVAELLRPLWSEAWEVWEEVFSDFSGEIAEESAKTIEKPTGRASPAAVLAGIAGRREALFEASPPLSLEEMQRLFFCDLCANLVGGTSKLLKNIAACLGQTVSAWRDGRKKWLPLSETSLRALLPEPEQRLRASLLRFCAFAWRVWDEMKLRRDLLSFSDLIRFAALSIREDPRRKGFRHVLIDEFQDTDPLQDAMIRALREKEGAKLFLVGDPKQAIYRFRHADLTLFADYVLQSRASGSDVSLSVSFRTRAALLKRVNAIFANLWKDGLGSGERMRSLKFEPLSAPEPGDPDRELSSIRPLTVLLAVKKGRELRPAHARLAAHLARLFKRCVEDQKTVWDKQERRLRPVRWRDFAVLTPTRGVYEVLEAAFEREGVPAAFAKSMGYFTRGEVTDVINTLKAAAFPEDEAALAGWLASPFSGVPQGEVQSFLQTLAAERKRLRETSFFSLLRDSLPDAADRLARLRRAGRLKGPSAVLSRLLEDRRWLSAFDGAQRLRVLGNVSRATAAARQYEGGVAVSLAGCAQWLDTALRSGKPAEEPEWLDENADAVRVTTVHASKGLEYPVVAVMQMERGVINRPSSALAPSKSMGVALSDFPDSMMSESEAKPLSESEAKPLSLKWERALEEQGELEESARLFYVAATRAQDALIFCGVVSARGAAPGPSMGMMEAGEGALPLVGDEGDEVIVLSESDEDAAPEGPPPPPPPVSPPLPLSLPPTIGRADSPAFTIPITGPGATPLGATSFALFEWCPFAWRRRHRQGLDLRWEVPDALDEEEGAGGPEVGTLAHWILARWDMREETLGEWLDEDGPRAARLLPAALRGVWKDAKNRDALRGWLAAFSLSEEGRVLAGALKNGVLCREGAFCVTLGGVRLVGATDVLWRDGGLWHVRDYKITLSDSAPAELYRAQLAFYALTTKLLAERGDPARAEHSERFEGVDVGLIFLREGGLLGDTRRFRAEDDWPAMQEQVLSAARAAAQGPWLPRRDRCRRCPWRARCPKRG
ncbi:MAG: UvrD-helicase domain-containing protein [Synergistaceae bacterium]|jgi:ATP-dependent exoDNAse (exonuclease V) beta subunit|nr:UvrD-helicase domain-containing protein [Synergistaceae bacterium]